MSSNYNLGPCGPDVNKGPMLMRLVWTLLALSTVVMTLRIWTKVRKTHRLYYDDGVMVVALLLGYVQAIVLTCAIHYGFGRHICHLDVYQEENAVRIGVLVFAWGILSAMAGRVAFCVTMLFLTGTDPRVKRWHVWVFIVLQPIFNILQVALFYAQCGTHLDSFWMPALQHLAGKYCWDSSIQSDVGYFVGAFNSLTDLYLTVLPAILIEHTRLSIKRKVGLAFLLCLSIVALAASLVKAYFMKDLSELIDWTFDMTSYLIWVSVELNIVIIVASIPLLRPMFHRPQWTLKPEIQERVERVNEIAMGSVFSRKSARSTAKEFSTSSEENIFQHTHAMDTADGEPGIVVTTEVSVTYQPFEVDFVHAALVGLVQGEIANPHLVQR